jgi:hypothetical protein
LCIDAQDSNFTALLAALVGDVVTAWPAVCDAHPALLTDLAACEATAPAAARCMTAYLAHMSPEALTAALIRSQPDGNVSQVHANSPQLFQIFASVPCSVPEPCSSDDAVVLTVCMHLSCCLLACCA